MDSHRHLWETVFSVLVIIGAAMVFTALFVLNLNNTWAYTNSVSAVIYHYVLPAAVAAGLLAAIRLSRKYRLTLAICLLAVVPALYAMEGFLWYRHFQRLEGTGTAFDHRTKLQVITDLRQDGNRAFPAMRAKSIMVEGGSGDLISVLSDGEKRLLPIANVPRRTIVSCNETGRWMIFESDEYGFHNPRGRWLASPTKIALVGDSFTQGNCQPSESNIAAYLGRKFFDVVNLGTSGFGPLSQLASIKEYLNELRPHTVLWMFFEGNDLTRDLPTEIRSPILRAYLNRGFRQGLMENTAAIALLFERYLDDQMTEAMVRVEHPFEEVRDFLQLWRLRETFGLDPIGVGAISGGLDGSFSIFADVLREARRTVEGWGGRLVLVYLPDGPRYFAAARNSRIRDHIRARVFAIANETGLPVIDVHEAFAAYPDPKTLFVYPGSHYNADGYALAANTIAAKLGD